MTADRDALAAALRIHHPIMRSETGPFSGCRCGQVGPGENVIAHAIDALVPTVNRQIAAHLRAAANDLSVGYEPGQVEDWLSRIYDRADELDPPTTGGGQQ